MGAMATELDHVHLPDGRRLDVRLGGPEDGLTLADTQAVLDVLGADRCVVAGWSGGGPHALACAPSSMPSGSSWHR